MRGFQVFVGDEYDVGFRAVFQLMNFRAFFVQQECRHINRHLDIQCCCVFFHRFFLDNAQDVQCGRFDVANHARAITTWTGDV